VLAKERSLAQEAKDKAHSPTPDNALAMADHNSPLESLLAIASGGTP